MVNVVTQPYRRPQNRSIDNYLVTLASKFDLKKAVQTSGATVDLNDFLAAHPTGAAHIWAVGISPAALRAWARMTPGDLVLFYGHGEIFAYGTLASKTYWRDNNFIWPSGENWDHVYSLVDFHELPEGRRPEYQGLRAFTEKLDLFSVGCRNITEFGVSIDAITEWITTTGHRHEKKPARRSSRSSSTTHVAWDIPVGTTLRRAELHRRFGGSGQSGIASSARTPNVLVFSDPQTGKAFGYDKHEGRREDGSYRYTGEGQVGDQSETSQGNAALLRADAAGKSIRLFIKQDRDATYVGEYTLGDPPYDVERANDRNGNERDVLVFHLVPVSSEAPIPLSGTKSTGPLFANRVSTSRWVPPQDTPVVVSGRGVVDSDRTMSRQEMRLQKDFGEWLQARGAEVESLSIPINGGTVFMRPDLFNKTDSVVIEAKKSSARSYVREAIGQVLDYVNNLKLCDDPITASPAILLPARPEDDLIGLCDQLGITVIYRKDGTFVSQHTSDPQATYNTPL
jgi:hypothetical protein